MKLPAPVLAAAVVLLATPIHARQSNPAPSLDKPFAKGQYSEVSDPSKWTNKDLCGLPFSPAYWDVLPEGYNPSILQ